MNNLFSAGLLTISVIALNGCKESVDLRSHAYSSSQTANSIPTTTRATNQAPTSIIVTTPPVSVIRVVNVTNPETGNTDTSDSATNTNPPTDTNTDTDAGTDAPTETNTDTDAGTETPTDTNTDAGTETPEAPTETENTVASCEAFADPITPFVRVQLHYGLLSDAPFVPGETEGSDSLTVTADAAKGATKLSLDSTALLKPSQLITYVGTNGHHRVAEIGEIIDGGVTITSEGGLETAIPAGSKISNFYYDPTHPNVNGYKAVADFGVRSAYPITPAQTHVILGDSWFDASEESAEFEKQLKVRLPGSTIVNEGIGGHTLCDLINRFDRDVTPNNPAYVWVNSSINDYFNDVPAADFKIRMQYLISKIQSIGAKAIIFDSAPTAGSDTGGSDARRRLSYQYATAVYDLFKATQQ